jgi:protein pelota
MRFKGKYNLKPGQSGVVHLIIDTEEDLWALYNIMAIGDCIKLATFRKVQHESGSKVTSKKRKMILTLRIEEIDYSPEGIRFRGKNVSQNEYVAIGQYQTDEIGINSFFSLYKSYWDEMHLETLKNATDITQTSEVVAILMDEGMANLFYISNTQTVNKGKINISIPKKRNGSTQHDKGREKFFQKVLEQFLKNINFENIKVVIIASPGFTQEDFKKYMEEKIENNKEYSFLKNNLKKLIYTHSSSGFKHSLEEILAKKEIRNLIKDVKCVDDVSVMERFNEILGTEMDKIFFGHKQFLIAFEKKAIDTLIFTDGYLRKLLAKERKDLSEKIKELKSGTTEVCQFSSLHTTGEKIDEFGGIVGILKYIMPELNEMEEEEDDDKKNTNNLEEEIKDENLIELINNNSVSYNMENEEDEKEDKKEEKKGKKKTKEENKTISQQKRKYQRKRSSFDDNENNYEDNDVY